MLKRIIILSLLISFFTQSSYSQIPGLTFSKKKEQPDLYLKSKTIWLTATPFFFVERRFSPNQGSTYIKVGMFGGNLKPYVKDDSVANRDLNNYKLTRVFGIAQMGVIAPLLAYLHFENPGPESYNNEDIDNLQGEETGYLTAAIIVFCTGTLTYHVFSKGFLFDALERYNYVLGNKTDFEDVSFNMNMRIDPVSQTPQISFVWTF
ncbi:MAG TPA: hypothetical protein DCG75_10025 [Bacteroidales bacterium]|jgi:hypothetical protein|nr:hypothetical protein [Bacteroidales bacterium]